MPVSLTNEQKLRKKLIIMITDVFLQTKVSIAIIIDVLMRLLKGSVATAIELGYADKDVMNRVIEYLQTGKTITGHDDDDDEPPTIH